MKITMWDEKNNTLYIASSVILPNTKGMTLKQHRDEYHKAFEMSYKERIIQFANEEQQKIIYEEMGKHEGCKISEFSTMF